MTRFETPPSSRRSNRDELVALLEAETDIREGRTTSAEEARERFGTSDE